jgi:anti-sigma factor RsiW
VSYAHVREELGGYVIAELDPGEREDVAAHLARCPDAPPSTSGSPRCRRQYERIRVVRRPDATDVLSGEPN